jgi:hypothetical protein
MNLEVHILEVSMFAIPPVAFEGISKECCQKRVCNLPLSKTDVSSVPIERDFGKK